MLRVTQTAVGQLLEGVATLHQNPKIADTTRKVTHFAKFVIPSLLGFFISELTYNLIAGTPRTKLFLYCFTCGTTAGLTNSSPLSCVAGLFLANSP